MRVLRLFNLCDFSSDFAPPKALQVLPAACKAATCQPGASSSTPIQLADAGQAWAASTVTEAVQIAVLVSVAA